MAFKVLVASYTHEIQTVEFDPEERTLKDVSSTTVGFHPSWLTAHPDEPSLVFTGLEQEDGKVIALKVDERGVAKVVSEVSSGGHSPCTLLATADELFVGNYMSGSLAVVPISSSEPYILSSTPTLVQFEGTGPNPDRQECSHAHHVVISSEGSELFVADLGADKTWRLQKDASGHWTVHRHISYPAGGGPRHLVIHGDIVYTLLELTSTVVSHRLEAHTPFASQLKSAPTLSPYPPTLGSRLAAEILLPEPNAAYPIPYIYVSNRNDPSPDGDTIAIFTPELELVAQVRTGLKHLRGMVFGGENSEWLIAGGAQGGGVKVFRRVNGGQGLEQIAALESVEAPTGFLWL